MKILIVHRYYWPDTAPAATIFRTVAQRWTDDGHQVTAFSAQPSYTDTPSHEPRDEMLDGSRIIRTWLMRESKSEYIRRSLNFGIFFLKAFIHAVRGNYDVIVALTVPPILPAAVLKVAARLSGAALVYQCMDIFPELALNSGLASPGRKTSLLKRLDASNVNAATRTVVLSGDMKQSLLERGADGSSIVVINNVDIEEFTEAAAPPESLDHPSDVTQVLFAGNLGRFQSLDTVIDAAHELADDTSIRFDFLGSGIMQSELQEQAGTLLGSSVHFHGRVSATAAAAAARNADIVLITLAPGVIRTAYPSKTVTYLRAGTPIIAMVESDSDLGAMIETEGLGAVVTPGDAAGLARAITAVAASDRTQIREACNAVYADRFDRGTLLDKWSALLDSIEAERGR